MLRENMGRKMTREEQLKVAFYQGEGVYSVLKRFEFSATEKELIYLAIATASKKHPDMKLIKKADALLKMVASSREPIEETEDPTEKIRKQASLDANYSLKKAQLKDNLHISPMSLMLLGMAVIVFMTAQFSKSYQADWYVYEYGKMPYTEAVRQCNHRNDKIPTAVQVNEVFTQYNVFQKIGMYFENKDYWVNENGKPMVYQVRDSNAHESSADVLHEVMCLDNANSFF